MQRSIIISITLTTVFIHTGYCIPSFTGNSRNVPPAETNVPRRGRITPDLNHREESQPSSPALQAGSPAQPILNLSELIAPGRRPSTPGNPYYVVQDLNQLPLETEEAAPSAAQQGSSAEAALIVTMGNQRRGKKPILILPADSPRPEPRPPIRPHEPTSLVLEQRAGEVARYVHETNAQPRPQPQPQPRFVPQPPAMGNQGNYLPQLNRTGRMEFVEVINPRMVRPQDIVLTPAQMIGPDRQMTNRFVPWAPPAPPAPPAIQPRGQASGSQPPPLGNRPLIPVFERNQLIFSGSQPPPPGNQPPPPAQGRGQSKGQSKGKGIQRGG